MKHTIDWAEENCNEFVTYDDDFQIWKRKGKEEYWAYDEDEEMFVQVKLIALERFPEDVDALDIMDKYENDWCGEVDDSYGWLTDDEDCEEYGYDYAWFERMEEC